MAPNIGGPQYCPPMGGNFKNPARQKEKNPKRRQFQTPAPPEGQKPGQSDTYRVISASVPLLLARFVSIAALGYSLATIGRLLSLSRASYCTYSAVTCCAHFSFLAKKNAKAGRLRPPFSFLSRKIFR